MHFEQSYIFDIDTSISLGLILNELVTNSYKHALKESRELGMLMQLRETEKDHFELTSKDNGQPMTTSFEEATKKGFGLRLASRLTKQLQGDLNYSYTGGNEFRMVSWEKRRGCL